jgi:hypothetical protein
MSYRFYTDVWIYSENLNRWTCIVGSRGPSPTARAHAFVGFDGGDNLVYFGGTYNTASGEWVYFGDTWLLNFETHTWTNITAQLDTGPSHRAAGISAYHEDVGFVICGGKDLSRAYMDVWRFYVNAKVCDGTRTPG